VEEREMNLLRTHAMSHLPFSYVLDGNFILPFVLGKDDTTGDNISMRKEFSETRGHYWLWKNMKFADDEFVSVQQYRRCFWFPPLMDAKGPFAKYVAMANDNFGQQIFHMDRPTYIEYVKFVDQADRSQLQEWLSPFDIIISNPLVFKTSVGQMYAQHHIAQDWEIFAYICGKHGYDDGKNRMLTGHLMFIMRPEIFDEYMTEWWRVMSEVADRLSFNDDPYQHRSIGYLSERFVSAWILRMRVERPTLRILNLPICEGLFQLDRKEAGVM
jgi:hypothetical protein